jgi:hypothetical protein
MKSLLILAFLAAFVFLMPSVFAATHNTFIWSPLNQTYTTPYGKTDNVTYNISAIDTEVSDSHFKFSIYSDGVSIYQSNNYANNTYISGTLILQPGFHNITANATDHATTNVSSNVTYFTTDYIPIIFINSPQNLTYASTPLVSFYAYDDDPSFDLNATLDGIIIVNLPSDNYVNGTLISNISLSNLQNGIHNFTVITGDADEAASIGNNDTNISTVYFTIGTFNSTVVVQFPFQVTSQNCINSNTLQLISSGTVDNVVHTGIQDQYCNYGCDSLNNICNPSPTTQNLEFVGIIVVIFVVIIIIAYKLTKR